MKAHVIITLKTGVLDPQGKAIQNALHALGFTGVDHVRQGKFIELELAESDPSRARAEVERMCEALLANMVIENYPIMIGDEALAEGETAPDGAASAERREAS